MGLIPARSGSQRVRDKNLRLVGGRPLVQRALDTALAAPSLHEVYVTSDSSEVLRLAEQLKTGSAIRRPDHIASAGSPAIEYVRHALKFVERNLSQVFDAVAILQPSSPFTSVADIEGTVGLLKSSGADSAVTVVAVPHDLHPVKFKSLDGVLLRSVFEEESGRSSPEHLAPVYVRNGSVYCSRVGTINAGSILGSRSAGFLMPRERSVDINDEFDLMFAEFLEGRLSSG